MQVVFFAVAGVLVLLFCLKRRRPAIWYITAIASLAVGILPIIVLERWFGVPRKITVGYGVVAWAVAVAVKAVIHHLVVDRAVRRGSNPGVVSVVHGLLSAICELGVAAAFLAFVWRPSRLAELIGFGAGAGMVEAVMMPFLANTFKGSTIEAHASDVAARSAGNAVIQLLNVLERIWATVIQVSTRGMVYLTIATANPVPAAIALSGFASVDGMAYYGLLRKWRFDRPRALARVHAYLGAAALTLAFAFALFAGLFNAGRPWTPHNRLSQQSIEFSLTSADATLPQFVFNGTKEHR